MTEIVAEIGINASGSLDIAKKLIDVAHAAGCDYVKFQKRTIDLVYSKEELESKRESPWGTTFADQKYGLEFSEYEYGKINAYCHEKGMKWFASPWDWLSLKMLNKFPDCCFIKIPSALITNDKLLKECQESEKKVILSTGMSTMPIIDHAIDVLGKNNIYCIMACTSTYPSKPEEQNLNCVMTYQKAYPWAKIGFSNHNPGIIFMPIAVALGAEMIEFHITLDRASYGSDQAASIEPSGVHHMGDGIKRIYDSEMSIIKKLRR
jgi:N-acetylneuraminate synthase